MFNRLDTLEKHAFMLAVLLIIVVIAGLGYAAVIMVTIPRCQEDVVLIGENTFDAGRWSHYRCGPAVDDFR